MSGTRSGGDGTARPSFFSSASDKEEWEILCGLFEGPDRMRLADNLAAGLKRVAQTDLMSHLDAGRVHVVHEEQASRITYGPYFASYDDKGHIALPADMQRDIDYVRRLSVNEQFPFFSASKQPVPTPDVGPKEWDLHNARGVYSLQIGCFYNTPNFRQRKEAAVEWVRDLRGRGFEAFYLHGPKMSLVTVGSFDEGAYTERKVKDPRAEVVVPRGPTRDYRQDVIKLRQNPEFAYNHINAAVEKVNGIPNESFLVAIPRRDEAVNLGSRP